jgi:hypothetical protein
MEKNKSNKNCSVCKLQIEMPGRFDSKKNLDLDNYK